MTTLALVGAVASPTMALATDDGHDDGDSVSVERNNEIEQSNEIEQEACTNEQETEAENEGDDGQVAVATGGDQSNGCVVVQGASATNTGAIVDASTNDIAAILAELDIDDSVLVGL